MVIDGLETPSAERRDFSRPGRVQGDHSEGRLRALAKISDHQPEVIFVDLLCLALDGSTTMRELIKKKAHFAGTQFNHASSTGRRFDARAAGWSARQT